MMTFSQAKDYLNSFINHEFVLPPTIESFELVRIKKLLEVLGNPQNNLKFIHVAGSKGKGSTSAITASILNKAGYLVGLYTSPHLNDIRERIRLLDSKNQTHGDDGIFRDIISEEEFAKTVEEVRPFTDELQKNGKLGSLTFFEVFTALSVYYFAKKKVDFVVLETGLGGRLDATNAIDTIVCALTPISLEHTRILGDTITKIAQEKAAIIKHSNQKVVIAPQVREAEEVFNERCRKFNIEPLRVGVDIRANFLTQNTKEQLFEVRTKKNNFTHLKLPLLGWHQVINAAVAIGVIESLQDLGFSISSQAVYDGTASVLWPGRFEIVSHRPLVILDSAHNDASCQVLIDTVRKLLPQRKIILILGASDDKNKKAMGHVLNQAVDEVIVTRSNHPRAGLFTDELLRETFPNKPYHHSNSIEEALQMANNMADWEDVILVTGSIFVVSEARRILCTSSKV